MEWKKRKGISMRQKWREQLRPIKWHWPCSWYVPRYGVTKIVLMRYWQLNKSTARFCIEEAHNCTDVLSTPQRGRIELHLTSYSINNAATNIVVCSYTVDQAGYGCHMQSYFTQLMDILNFKLVLIKKLCEKQIRKMITGFPVGKFDYMLVSKLWNRMILDSK